MPPEDTDTETVSSEKPACGAVKLMKLGDYAEVTVTCQLAEHTTSYRHYAEDNPEEDVTVSFRWYK